MRYNKIRTELLRLTYDLGVPELQMRATEVLVSTDPGGERRPLNPSILSKVFFCWVFPFLRIGRFKGLELGDIHPIPTENGSEIIAKRMTRSWLLERNKSSPNLTTALISTFLPSFAYGTFLSIVKDCIFRVVQGPALGFLMGAFSNSYQYKFEDGIYAGAGLIVSLLLFTVFQHYSIFLFYELGMRIRVALTMLIYDKALRLSQFSIGKTNVGEIINLLTNDANRFDRAMPFIPYLIIAPLQIASVTGVLWFYLGPSCFSLPALLLLLVPFQSWVGKYFGKLRVDAAKKTDNRVRIINEAINGIQIIKMCTYENVYFQKVLKARKSELKMITKKWLFDALNKSVFDVSSKLMIMVTLLIYILAPKSVVVVDPTTVFVTLTLANYLRNTITNFLPMAITGLFELRVSIKRIQAFLLLEEKEDISLAENNMTTYGISIKNFTTRWTKDGQQVISNASMEVQPGKLTALIGSVASGKTSLIHGILGELSAETGSISVGGSIAYAPQDPWIFSGTIQDNILAGEELDNVWYEKVVEACSLSRDMHMFPEGDQTNVGEKGMVLSGGQKARVNLARAVYRNADIYLLDDPLSAVDVKVGKVLFENCICGLLKSKTVLLVTHHLTLLSKYERAQVVLLKEGRVASTGTFAEVKQHLDFDIKSGFDVDHHDTEKKSDHKADPAPVPSLRQRSSSRSKSNTPKRSKKDDREEARTKGSVSWSIHRKYFSAGNGCLMFLYFLLTTFAAQIFTSGSDYWLKVWSGKEANNSKQENETWASNDSKYYDLDRYFYIGIYGGIIGAIFVSSLLRNVALVYWTMSSSSKLHNTLFMSLVRAPMSFFEKNSIGRVLNRIVNDIGSIDDNLPRIYQAVVNNVFQICGAIFLVCFLQPLMAIPAVFLIIIFYFLRDFFLTTASDIKRIESIARSPVFAHVGTTIAGLTVIRALKSQGFHRQQFIEKQDLHSSTFYLNFGSNRWFALATDWLSTAYFFVLVISYWLVTTEDSSSLGLGISNALMLTLIFSFGVSQLTMLDNQLIAVERVLEYVDIPSEGQLDTPETNGITWGDKGKIEICKATIAYNGNPVLRAVTLSIKPGEHIGIVGRTGAGKSTLINGLYRLVNLASGQIKIDNVDISNVGLHNLRKRLTIIPQNPQLFTGTVRYNLDPLEVKSDDDLYRALNDVKLVERLENNLYTYVAQGGTNFSTGERQLLCLARAILSRTKILLLDEATASVDGETERIIQNVISEKFGDSTVLTIAHRLDTIIKCDRVLVLDAGLAVEFGEPHILLQSKSGHFYDLVNQTKGSGSEHLRRLAEEAYNERHDVMV